MKLYYAPGACSLAAHIIINHLDITAEYVKVDTKTHTYGDGADYYAVNAKGYVPALTLDNGKTLTENIAILTFLGESKPDAHLVPSHTNNTKDYYSYLETLGFVSTEIHKAYGPLWNPNLPADLAASTREKLTNRYGIVEKMLQKHTFLLGETFSVADAYLYTVTRWATKLQIDLSHFPKLNAYMDTITLFPAVQKSLSEEGLT